MILVVVWSRGGVESRFWGSGKTSAGLREATGKIKLNGSIQWPVSRWSGRWFAGAVVEHERQQLQVGKRREVGNGRCRKMVISQNVAVLLDGRSSTFRAVAQAAAMANPQFRGLLGAGCARAQYGKACSSPPGPSTQAFKPTVNTQLHHDNLPASCLQVSKFRRFPSTALLVAKTPCGVSCSQATWQLVTTYTGLGLEEVGLDSFQHLQHGPIL